MRNLEQLTKEAFDRYSQRTIGKSAAWHKLNGNRKKEWIEDTQMLVDELLGLLKEELAVKSPTTQPYTAYEQGMVHGTNIERNRVQVKIDDIRAKYQEEIEELLKK